MHIELEKITDGKFGGNHPNKIDEGFLVEGYLSNNYPVPGKHFSVQTGPGVFFKTSTVTEVIKSSVDGGIFKTLNSTYKWTKIIIKGS